MQFSSNHTTLKKDFDTEDFKVGASVFKVISWYLVNIIFFKSGIVPFSNILVWLLRIFGSTIGRGVRIKPQIQIKYPWKLSIGNFSWLGDCKIENLDHVTIGKHVCISDGAVLLTGNHDYNTKYFKLITAPIVIEDGVWISASSVVCPGIIAQTHSMLCVGSVANKDLEAYSIYQGNPAKFVRKRVII